MYKRSEFFLAATIVASALLISGCNKTSETAVALPAAASPSTTSPATTAAVDNVSDIDVTSHVKTALQQNDSLKGFDISVVTLKGDVRLIGVLDNQAQIDEAIKIARASEGAHTIHDELIIKK